MLVLVCLAFLEACSERALRYQYSRVSKLAGMLSKQRQWSRKYPLCQATRAWPITIPVVISFGNM